MDNRSPEDIRKSIKSLVEEAENVPIDDESPKIESDEKLENVSKLDSVSKELEEKYKEKLVKSKKNQVELTYFIWIALKQVRKQIRITNL